MRFHLLLLLSLISFSFSFGQEEQIDSFDYSINPLLLDEVLITDQSANEKLQETSATVYKRKTSTAFSTNETIADLPSLFVDNSAGGVYSRVFSRGISAAANENIGWYYMSLQEDGLPITAVQYNYFTPDFFHRVDLFTENIEAIIGGKSGVLSQNAPGGTLNFISRKSVTPISFTELKQSTTIHQNGNLDYRADLYLADWIGKGWHYNLAGFYRIDQGARNVDYNWNQGGQLRGRLTGVFKKGTVSFNWKYLRDQVNRNNGLAAVNWDNPKVTDVSRNLLIDAMLLPDLGEILIGNQNLGYSFDPSKGIQTNEKNIGLNAQFKLGKFAFDYRSKYSDKTIDWQTSFGNGLLRLNDFLPYFISSDPFPIGDISIHRNDGLLQFNNTGILEVFSGGEGSVEFEDGRSSSGGTIGGLALWKKQDQLKEWMQDFRVNTQIKNHHLSFGNFSSYSTLDYFTNASFAYTASFNAQDLYQVDLINLEGDFRQLSDENGISNYGGLFYEQGSIEAFQTAFMLTDKIDLLDQLSLDLGLRYEYIRHQGDQNVPRVFDRLGGLDGELTTSFDNGFLTASETDIGFDFNYGYLNYSLGASYKPLENFNFFARYSDTHKAPELDYYLTSFNGVGVEEKAAVQSIRQLEVGFKHKAEKTALGLTGFFSKLSNVASSDFVFDRETDQIFYSPIQFNETSTMGLELQFSTHLYKQWSLSAGQTLQFTEADNFTVYQANGSIDTTDDMVLDFSGNDLPHIPRLMGNAKLHFVEKSIQTYLQINFMGDRFANAENSFVLPSFASFSWNGNFQLKDYLHLNIKVNNLFNTIGLMNFFGPNSFGASANDATAEFINQNPNASFLVFPINARSVMFSLFYTKP